jgi:hypothetical protein
VALPIGGNGLTFLPMSESHRPKPLPARLPATSTAENGLPPVAVPSAPDRATAAAESPQAPIEPVPEEAEVVGRGGTWIARVLGRSGRAGRGSARLLLLGFREAGSASPEPTLEGLVAARSLGELSEGSLLAALERARPPRGADQRRPFFEEVDSPRRGGPASEY